MWKPTSAFGIWSTMFGRSPPHRILREIARWEHREREAGNRHNQYGRAKILLSWSQAATWINRSAMRLVTGGSILRSVGQTRWRMFLQFHSRTFSFTPRFSTATTTSIGFIPVEMSQVCKKSLQANRETFAVRSVHNPPRPYATRQATRLSKWRELTGAPVSRRRALYK